LVIGFLINSLKLIKEEKQLEEITGSNYRTKIRLGDKRHKAD
jgi:hypothetical protein